MATITFRTKVRTIHEYDGRVAWEEVRIPTLTMEHCDMAVFRRHPRYGGFANSDMFPLMLAKIRADVLAESTCKFAGWVKLGTEPDNVEIDTSGFLARVTITV